MANTYKHFCITIGKWIETNIGIHSINIEQTNIYLRYLLLVLLWRASPSILLLLLLFCVIASLFVLSSLLFTYSLSTLLSSSFSLYRIQQFWFLNCYFVVVGMLFLLSSSSIILWNELKMKATPIVLYMHVVAVSSRPMWGPVFLRGHRAMK